MKFCKNLLNDINFEPDFIQPCCDVFGVKVPKFDFKGGALNVKEYVQYIESIIPLIQKREICANCPNLMEIDDKNYNVQVAFDSVSINVHRYLCNCRCTYCGLWKKHTACDYDLLSAITSLFNAHILSKTCFFSWGGGEPTIFKQFEDISHLISQKGYYQYVHTNSIRFSKTLEQILHNNLGRINISLDCGTPQKYKEIKGVDKFSNVIENIIKYRLSAQHASQIDLKYIVFEQNNDLSEIEKFINLCKTTNIQHIQYSMDFREVRKKTVSEKTIQAIRLLIKSAANANIECIPFFVTPEYMKKIAMVNA